MNAISERNLGPQPITLIMRDLNLTRHDLVAASAEQITHKMVSRACKGRRLSMRVKLKILNALNKAAEKEYSLGELFDY